MSDHSPPPEYGPVVDDFLPTAIQLGVHALWQAGNSQQHIESVVMQTDAQLGDIESDIVAARTAYEDAIGAFTGEEACVLADQRDAEEQALDHLPAAPGNAAEASDAVATLFRKGLFIATESAGDHLQQRVPEATPVREEACSMVGGAAIAIDALEQIADCHPDVDRDEMTLPSRDASW
jgi:hypothetical protein